MSADPMVEYRLAAVEKRADDQKRWLQALDTGHGDQAVTVARHEERLQDSEEALVRLADTVNKGVWALVLFAFTVASSAVGLAITIGGGPT